MAPTLEQMQTELQTTHADEYGLSELDPEDVSFESLVEVVCDILVRLNLDQHLLSKGERQASFGCKVKLGAP